jgi:hypothetical protein
MNSEKILDLESRKCFDFFWKKANADRNSRGYGLIRDRAHGHPEIASIASIGFGLTAIIIGVEREWITRKQGYRRVLGTLDILLHHAEKENGFYYHFLNMKDGKRMWDCEVSLIDTAILICGAICAGEYFGEGAMEKAEKLYQNVDWRWYRDAKRNQFHMGYTPEQGFSGWWDFYAEQIMVYILAAASSKYSVNGNMLYDFHRHHSIYDPYPPFLNSWYGSIFTYQFTHAWFDLRNKLDKKGVNWWENSITATKTNRQFCIDNAAYYKTFGPNSWGLTACDGPWGYNGRYGAAPSAIYNNEHYTDGTVPPAGAAGSIVFTPEESIAAMIWYFEKHPRLWGDFGFVEAYNLDVPGEWYSNDVVGINKGITLIMIENYRTELIWDYFMKNKHIQRGMDLVGITDISEKTHIA